MKKLFLAICFTFCLTPFVCFSAVKGVSSAEEAKIESNRNPLQTYEERRKENEYFRNMSPEDKDAYLKERIKHVVINRLDKSDGLGGDGAINVQKSELQLAQEAEAKKSIFEKIYDKAMNNLINTTQPRPQAKMYIDETNMRPQAAEEAEALQKQQLAQRQAWLNSNLPMIDVELPPYNQKTLIPALEHIPYLFSRIELLPDGLIKVTDTVIVVANGEKLKESIRRTFPKFVWDREGKRQKVDYNLLNVTINGKPIEYKLSDRNNYIFMEPAQKTKLIPGVYEYIFDYTIDNQIFAYDEFDEFYWNLTGSVWNLVVARAGASVILPPNTKTLGQIALSGYRGLWLENTVNISQPQDNVLGFVSQTPLFIGQALQMIVSLPKGAVSNISLTKKFLRFINANGDIIFSAFGLLAIFLSYLISWSYIKKNKNTSAKGIYKDAALLRYFAKETVDKKTFGAFLLELYRKNIIDIEENDNNILLVRKTNNLSSLTKSEKKIVQSLFGKEEDILNINSFSANKIRKAFNMLKDCVAKKVKRLNFKLNIGYLFFSISMLLFSEAAIASLNYDFGYNFLFLLLLTAMLYFCLWLFQQKFAQKWKNNVARISSILFAAITIFVSLAVINLATTLLIALTIFVIQEYSRLYSQRDGLLSTYVLEAEKYSTLLKNKVDAIRLGRDFIKNQAAIFALDCEDEYSPCEQNKNVYKLDIMSNLLKKI